MSLELNMTVNSKTGFLPICYPLLLSLKTLDVPLFHHEHLLHNPLSSYKQSVLRAEEEFVLLLDSIEKLNIAPRENGNSDEILERLRQLYYALTEHFEACRGAASSLVPKGEEKKHPFLIPFWNRSKDYKHVDLVINQIKHRQNRFIPITFRSKWAAAHGFYVSGIRTSSSVGPNLDVHPNWNNQDTAFSFNRVLRRLFIDVYKVGSYLAETLDRFGVSVVSSIDPGGSRMFSIAKRISNIPNFGFPDEVEQEKFGILVNDDDDNRRIKLVCGKEAPRAIIPPGGDLSVKATFYVEEELSHVMPYLRRRK